MRYNYPAFLLRDEGKVTVIFPDVPGCLTFADSVEEAFMGAQEALEGHLTTLADLGMPMPAPSDLLAVSPSEEDEGNVMARILVPVTVPGKTVRTNITIDEGLLELIDSVSANRSAFFAEAARKELARRRG